MHELALELGMTIQDLRSRASAHELTVSWPLFFEYRRRQAERDQREADSKAGRR